MSGPRTAALLLAAGLSRRFGAGNKLLLPVAGVPMVRRVAETALASRARPVIVVTGHDAESVRAALAGLALTFVHNRDYATGLASSLRRGLAAVPDRSDAAIVMLADMPAVASATLDALIAALDPRSGRTAAVPVCRGRRGNPVIWHRTHFPALRRLGGDRGARGLLAVYGEAVVEVPVDDPGILFDIDSGTDLEN